MMVGRLLAAALMVVLAGGCSGQPPHTTRRPAGAGGSYPRPANVQDPAQIPSAGPVPSCDARASLRPSGPNPAPGHQLAGSTMDRIVRRGRLIVGVDQNGYLLAFRNPDTGQLIGFEIELAKEIARDLLGDPEAVQFRADGTWQRLYARWLNLLGPTAPPPARYRD